jgi:hypothetical protein
MILFIFWSLLNMFHDFLYKKITVNILMMLYFKFTFIFFFSLILIFLGYKNIKKISFNSLLYLFKWNLFKSVFSLFGMYFVYKQITIYSFFSLNLMFYTIPLWEFIINTLIYNNRINIKNNFFIAINHLIILIYFMYNISLYGIYNYVYGFLSAIMFSISNLLIIKTKETWKKSKYFLIFDILIFSYFMMIFNQCILIYNKVSFNLSSIIGNYYLYMYLIVGLVIQYLLYYFFFRKYESPSVILSNIDLITSFILDLHLGHNYNILELFVISMIILNKYWQKRIDTRNDI